MYQRLLIVDNEPKACTSLRRILHLDGYDVDFASSIAEMFRPRAWSDYFAILLDRKLPDGTTEEYMRAIKERAPQAAIVILTGLKDMESSTAALREGAEDYIAKPINPAALLATLARIQRVRQAEERAVQAERLAVVGQATASMAHESANLIQKICLAVEYLESTAIDDATRKAIDTIHRAEQGLERLLDELRQFSAPMRLNKERHSLQSVWRTAWTSVAASKLVERGQLHETILNSDDFCQIDEFRMEQVFRNLFENSIAASGENPQIEVCCKTVDGALRIAIHDNGEGLSYEQRKRVFQPFFTTKCNGTGLGMAITKRIIEAHGGKICVGNRMDGAEFVITLPRAFANSHKKTTATDAIADRETKSRIVNCIPSTLEMADREAE